MGGFEAGFSDSVEPAVRYHPVHSVILTSSRYPGEGQWKAGSLTGAVASYIVTEALEARFRRFGNPPRECKGINRVNCETYKSSRWETRT